MSAWARTKPLPVGILFLALVAAACSSSTPNGPRAGGQGAVVVAMTTAPSAFNVHTPEGATPETQAVIGAVWPSAYRLRPDFSVEPWLLSAEATVVSAAPFVVEWRIRPDASWSDGTPVSADDFESLYRHCSGRVPGAECVERAGYREITRFERVDDKTLRTRFRRPYLEFPSLFRNIPPSHVLADSDAGGAEWEERFRSGPVLSAGPYRFVSASPDEGVVLERNPGYFGSEPSLRRVVIEFLDPADQVQALRVQQVDVVVPDPTLDLVQTLETSAGVEVDVGAGAEMERLVFNLGSELLADPAVRRAVVLGIDRDGVVGALVTPSFPGARRLDNRAYAVNQSGYEAHGEEFAAHDVARAQAELEAAGFERDAEGVYGRDGRRLAFRISTTSGDGRREQALQLIQAQLAEVGILLTIDNADAAGIDARLNAGDFDLALIGRMAGPFPAAAVGAAYGTGGAQNPGGLSEVRVDELVVRAEAEPDAAARAVLVNQLDRLLWDLLPDVPLYQPPVVVAHAAGVRGVVANPTAQGHLWNLEEWSVEATGPGEP